MTHKQNKEYIGLHSRPLLAQTNDHTGVNTSLSLKGLDTCAGPKVETAQNWKRVRSFHFWVSPKLETAEVSTFGLDPKTGNAAAWPKVETSLAVC